MPLDVEKLLKEGASLSADDAEALERDLEQRPDDIEARARLIGYYDARGEEAFMASTILGKVSLKPQKTPVREALGRHAVWLAANASRTSLAAHPLLRLPASESIYPELSSIWRRQVAADQADSTTLANAIAFFWFSHDVFAEELLARAEQLFPEDRRWSDFRRQKRADELELAFQFEPSRALSDDAADDLTEKGLDEIEQLLRDGDPESEWVPRLREIAGTMSFALGRIERARAHAERMLTTVGVSERGHGDAVHNGHLLLGRLALRENDIERAGAHLILAGRVGATGMVPIFGPDMRLAAELLARDEREVVISYLSLCRSFWGRGPVDEWIAQIRAGSVPDFGRNLKGGGVG